VISAAVLLGLVALAVGIAAAAVVRLLPTLRLQLSALALLAVCLPLGVVLASGWVMFGMHDHAKVLSVALASAVAALFGAALLARLILRPVEQLRAVSSRLAAGDLAARAPEQGTRELRELGASFNEMATNIEELFDARRQLVAWASHDLRTPLASLRAMVETIEDGLATADEYLPAIDEQLVTLSQLVDDLFELALIDAGAVTLERRDAPLGSLIATCLRSVDPEARRRNIHLEARLDPADPNVRIAPEQVERVLRNLLANAVRHTPANGAVSVTVQPDTDHLVVAVEDTGDGLPPKTEQRMFERFWRNDDSRTRSTGGAGLGLAIAQGLVRAHGGEIWAENRSSGGARVAFTLPLAVPDARLD
jgi:signal transduction histidine kinase